MILMPNCLSIKTSLLPRQEHQKVPPSSHRDFIWFLLCVCQMITMNRSKLLRGGRLPLGPKQMPGSSCFQQGREAGRLLERRLNFWVEEYDSLYTAGPALCRPETGNEMQSVRQAHRLPFWEIKASLFYSFRCLFYSIPFLFWSSALLFPFFLFPDGIFLPVYFSLIVYTPQQNLSSNINIAVWLHSIF